MNHLLFLLKRDDLTGFCVRVLALSAVLLVSFVVGLGFCWTSPKLLFACQMGFLIVLFCTVLGHFAGEFPRGSQFTVFRLTGTIAARSGLVLFFLLVTRSWDLPHRALIYYILAFYTVGLMTDVVLSSLKNWQTGSRVRSSEFVAN